MSAIEILLKSSNPRFALFSFLIVQGEAQTIDQLLAHLEGVRDARPETPSSDSGSQPSPTEPSDTEVAGGGRGTVRRSGAGAVSTPRDEPSDVVDTGEEQSDDGTEVGTGTGGGDAGGGITEGDNQLSPEAPGGQRTDDDSGTTSESEEPGTGDVGDSGRVPSSPDDRPDEELSAESETLRDGVQRPDSGGEGTVNRPPATGAEQPVAEGTDETTSESTAEESVVEDAEELTTEERRRRDEERAAAIARAYEATVKLPPKSNPPNNPT